MSAAGVSTKPWFVGDERWRAGGGRQGEARQAKQSTSTSTRARISASTTRQLSFEQPGPCSPKGTASVPEQNKPVKLFQCLAWDRVVGGQEVTRCAM